MPRAVSSSKERSDDEDGSGVFNDGNNYNPSDGENRNNNLMGEKNPSKTAGAMQIPDTYPQKHQLMQELLAFVTVLSLNNRDSDTVVQKYQTIFIILKLILQEGNRGPVITSKSNPNARTVILEEHVKPIS